MCGIIGYIGKEKKLGDILTCLDRLEYRGYDSSGIAYLKNEELCCKKMTGKIENLKTSLSLEEKTRLAITHTRWATHGKVNDQNCHPHQSGKIWIVHNGIIENAGILKEQLIHAGYHFQSETDSEVAAALLDDLYQKSGTMERAISEFFTIVKGTFAIGCICEDQIDTLYAIKKDSPLIIGLYETGSWIASDVPAILQETNRYFVLEDQQFAKIKGTEIEVFDASGKAIKIKEMVYEEEGKSMEKDGFAHFMLKEIYEQPKHLDHLFKQYLEEEHDLPSVTEYQKIEIVACGSAYHAGLLGKHYLEQLLHVPIQVELASEYRYKTLFLNKKCLVIFISQSGETADTLAAVKIAKNAHAHTIGIVNVVGSSIAREVDEVIYTHVGSEIAVATTKAYTAQVATFLLLALQNAKRKNFMTKVEWEKIKVQTKNVQKALLSIFYRREEIKSLAKELYQKEDIYFIGRQQDEALAQEASLKLKEISYIHSEAYAAGELKHGTISLIEKNTPVIGILTEDSIADKTISNLVETVTRGANAILITSIPTSFEKQFILPQVEDIWRCFTAAIVIQLLAYEIALLRNCDIDQPRNLAKSVTVE